MGELRLHHIELGYPKGSTLARAFDQLKRSAGRGLRPKVEASARRYTGLRGDAQHGPGGRRQLPALPWACGAIAFGSLLREPKAANVKLAHAVFQALGKCLLVLPFPKMDRQGAWAAGILCWATPAAGRHSGGRPGRA